MEQPRPFDVDVAERLRGRPSAKTVPDTERVWRSVATVSGMRFDHATLLNVSDHYARFLSGKGEVTIATIVR